MNFTYIDNSDRRKTVFKGRCNITIPSEIVESIKKGECILFLGAMASAPSPKGSPFQYSSAPPSGAELSRRLSSKCNYTYEDVTNLQRVSLHFQYSELGSRAILIKAIAEEVTGPMLKPSPAHHMLAALPFCIVITTNYDHLFDKALRAAKTTDGLDKEPLIRIYDPTRSSRAEDIIGDPTEQRPFVFKLHGDIAEPESIVITEEDYITFIQRMSTPNLYPIPGTIQFRMQKWPTLFIGYSLKDYNLRLLFRTLSWNVDMANFPLSYSVDPFPDDIIVSVLQKGEKKIVTFIKEDLWSFVPALYKECKGAEYQQ